jgi:hypothetical protein
MRTLQTTHGGNYGYFFRLDGKRETLIVSFLDCIPEKSMGARPHSNRWKISYDCTLGATFRMRNRSGLTWMRPRDDLVQSTFCQSHGWQQRVSHLGEDIARMFGVRFSLPALSQGFSREFRQDLDNLKIVVTGSETYWRTTTKI